MAEGAQEPRRTPNRRDPQMSEHSADYDADDCLEAEHFALSVARESGCPEMVAREVIAAIGRLGCWITDRDLRDIPPARTEGDA